MAKKKIIDKEVVERKLYAKTNKETGAKSKFDIHHEEIIRRTRIGASIKDRCGGLIHKDTYFEWFNAGEEDIKKGNITQYSVFSEKIKEAENEYREELKSYIKLHAPNDWKAASWLIERSDPETYKLREKMDVKQEIDLTQKAILEIPNNGKRKIKDEIEDGKEEETDY